MQLWKFKLPIFICLCLCLAGLLAQTLQADPVGSGGQLGALLNWGAGARSLGMGRAFVSVADDASATYWNPAGMTQISLQQATFLHAALWADTTYDFFSYVYPTTDLGTYGLSLLRLSSGGFEQTDVNNVVTGSFSDTYTVYSFSYGAKVVEGFSVGANVKCYEQQLAQYINGDYILDAAGFLAEPVPSLRLGLMIQNILGVEWGDVSSDVLPFVFRGGASYKFLQGKFLTSVDLEKDSAPDMHWFCGGEYWAINQLALRMGFNYEEFLVGFGVKQGEYAFDYGYSSQSLGGTNWFSVSASFGQSVLMQKLEEAKRYYSAGVESYKSGLYAMALDQMKHSLVLNEKSEDTARDVAKLTNIVEQLHVDKSEVADERLMRSGLEHYIEGDNPAALNSMTYALTLHPESDRILQVAKYLSQESGVEFKEKRVIEGLSVVDKKLFDSLNHFYSGQYDQVISDCQDILDLEPNNKTALMRMGSAYFQIGQRDKAIATWKRALQVDPNDQDLRDMLKKAGIE